MTRTAETHRPSRLGWLVAGVLVVVAGLIWLIASLTGNGDSTSTAGSARDGVPESAPTVQRPTPDRENSGPPATSQPPDVDAETLSAAVADLRTAVESSIAERPGGHESEKVLKDLDKLDESLAAADPQRLSRNLDHFEKSVDRAVDKGEISSSGQQSIEAAIAAVHEHLP